MDLVFFILLIIGAGSGIGYTYSEYTLGYATLACFMILIVREECIRRKNKTSDQIIDYSILIRKRVLCFDFIFWTATTTIFNLSMWVTWSLKTAYRILSHPL